MEAIDPIGAFLAGGPHAVVGASRDRSKFGNKVLRAYLERGMPVFAVNPSTTRVEGLLAYPDLSSLPEPVHGISVITPPHVTERIVDDAIRRGIRHVWLQPGAESVAAVRRAEQADVSLIWGGPCVLVEFRKRA